MSQPSQSPQAAEEQMRATLFVRELIMLRHLLDEP